MAHQFQPPVMMFNDRAAAVDPISAIDISDAADLFDCRRMDMSANYAIEVAMSYVVCDSILEITDEADGLQDVALGVIGKRPVSADAEFAAQQRERAVKMDQKSIGNVPEYRYPAVIRRHLVIFVAMQQQVTLAIGRGMDIFARQGDIAERAADIFSQRLVVIARDQDDACLMPRLSEDFLHYGIMLRRPIDTTAHRPKIYDIADQENILGVVFPDEGKELFGAACARAEMDVG